MCLLLVAGLPFAGGFVALDKGTNAASFHDQKTCALQTNLLWGLDALYSDRWICCGSNSEYAERAHTFENFLKRTDLSATDTIVFYDSRCGIPLFRAPVGRTLEEWWEESILHGWPSFRPQEAVSKNVRMSEVDPSGGAQEVTSACGTHLGHNIPDASGDRYCMNILCLAGKPGGELRADVPEPREVSTPRLASATLARFKNHFPLIALVFACSIVSVGAAIVIITFLKRAQETTPPYDGAPVKVC